MSETVDEIKQAMRETAAEEAMAPVAVDWGAHYYYTRYVVEPDLEEYDEDLRTCFKEVRGIVNRVLALGNIDDNIYREMKSRIHQVILHYKRATPYFKLTHKQLSNFAQIEGFAAIQLARARGGFERRQQVTQVKQTEVRTPESRPRGGMLRKFFPFGRRGHE